MVASDRILGRSQWIAAALHFESKEPDGWCSQIGSDLIRD